MSAFTVNGCGTAARHMPVWRVVANIIRFRCGLWCLDFLAVVVTRVLSQLAPGFVLRWFFNVLSGTAPAGFTMGSAVALWVAIWLGQALGSYVMYRADVRFFVDVAALLRRNLLTHLLRQPGAAPLPDAPGEAVSRFRNDVREVPLFTVWINDALVGLVMAAISVGVLLSMSVWLTLLALLPLILVGLIAHAAMHRIARYHRLCRETTGSVTGFLGELYGAAQAVKVAGAEESMLSRFNAINETRRAANVREKVFDGILGSLYSNTDTLSTGVVLVLAGQLMRTGALALGDFSLFVYLLQSMHNLTTFAGMLTARYKQLGVSLERMQQLMKDAPAEALTAVAPVNLAGPLPALHSPPRTVATRLTQLTARSLSFRYPGSAHGIADIDLDLRRGSLTVITGRVGSGKTTLVRVLLGLLPKDGGTVRWNGTLVHDAGSFFVPPHCAYTAQVPRLFSTTLRDNILLGQAADDEQLHRALHLGVLEQEINHLEHGLDTMIGPRGVKLSGGQLQRAAAVRMLIRAAELMVVDDLSSALDVETERTLWERLLKTTDSTYLVVSHRHSVLARAHEVIVMRAGRIVARGTYAALQQTCDELQRLQHDVPPHLAS